MLSHLTKRSRLRVLATSGLLLGAALPVLAQQLEPGAYAVSPVGVNVFLLANNLAGGDLSFDPSLPIEDGKATVNTTSIGYIRALSVLGRSANVGVGLPIVGGNVQGVYLGEFTKVDRFGLGDPSFRFSINLRGAPAMSPGQFADYRQKTNIGFSAVVIAPLGQYDPAKLINLGTNRWSFKPELGVSKALGRWTLELYAGAWLFTDNTDFFGGKTRKQDPIGSGQLHVLYTLKPRMWIAFNANFYTGGRTSVDGLINQDLQRNSRYGVTFTLPLNRRHMLRFAFSRGAFTTIGADFDALAISYQFAWLGGVSSNAR